MDGFYIAPAFMDKLVVHVSKNFMTLPNIKVYFVAIELVNSFLVQFLNVPFYRFL